jgi:hypothetical protein
MRKLYIDVDGVLLTGHRTQAAEGVEEFVRRATASFECFWLTTHCQGDTQPVLEHLAQHLPAATVKLLRTVKPTQWRTLKTEALDLGSDFYWLDDRPLQVEVDFLERHGARERLILVNLEQPAELARVMRVVL